MNLLKKVILILSVFCVAMPARAMEMNAPKYWIVFFGWGMLALSIGITKAGWATEAREANWIAVAINPDLETTEALLTKEGYLREKDCNGCTPLHWAAHQGQEEKVKLLLAHGADVAVKDNGGWTPLYTAAFHGHIETVRCLLQHAPFSLIKKSNQSESQERIKEALLVFMRNSLPRDVRNKILAYLPEDTLNQTHCRLAFSCKADLKQLVANCPLEWFLRMYDAIKPGHKIEFLAVMIPAITEYRMGKVRELLADPKLQELDPATTDPVILAMLDVANIEQHRAAIEQNVRKAFTNRVLQKYQMDELNNVNQVVQDVMQSDLQKNLARD